MYKISYYTSSSRMCTNMLCGISNTILQDVQIFSFAICFYEKRRRAFPCPWVYRVSFQRPLMVSSFCYRDACIGANINIISSRTTILRNMFPWIIITLCQGHNSSSKDAEVIFRTLSITRFLNKYFLYEMILKQI